MQALTIRFPDDLLAKAEARAAQVGHASVQQYIEALVRMDAGSEADAGIDPLSPIGDADVEALLLRRLERTDRDVKGTPFGTNPMPPRPIGLAAGEFRVPDDFDTPLPPDDLARFDGRP